jgi:RimJ/RimL family protein N-acetyltransferase
MKIIRLIEKKDLERRYKAIIDPSINEWLMLPSVSFARTEKWFQSVISDTSRRDFVGVLDDNIFGFSGITHISQQNKSAEVYIFLTSSKYFSKGLGSWLLKETLNIGFKELGITRFYARVVKKNEQSKKLFTKNNFEVEGVHKKDEWIKGAYYDIILFGKIFKERK